MIIYLCGSEAQYRGHVEFCVTFRESAERLLLPLSPWSWSIIIVVCQAITPWLLTKQVLPPSGWPLRTLDTRECGFDA